MRKQIHPLVKFKKFWDKLDYDSQADLWKFLTALRGPDFDDKDDYLKYNTTGVIRSYLLESGNHCPAVVNRIGDFLIKGELNKTEVSFSIRNYNSHFEDHAERAMRVIQESKLERIGIV